MSLCKFKDAFGKPNEGVHKHVLGIAVFDLVGTILACYLIHRVFHFNFWYVLIIALIASILIHKLFCVQTTLTKAVFST